MNHCVITMPVKKTFQPVLSKDVCLIYELLYRRGFVSFPLTKEGQAGIDAVVASINGVYFGQNIYQTAEEKAVAYLYFLIKDHPFTDGNKRTAVLIFEIICRINDLRPNYKDAPLDAVAVFIEKTSEPDHHLVISALAKILFHLS